MFVTLLRVIKYGFYNFWRNGLLSFYTILVMMIAFFVFEGLVIFNFVSNKTIEMIQEKIDISVYFKSNTPEDEILNLKKTIEGLEEVKSVDYISKEEALKIFKERHQEDEIIRQTLEELDVNPLLASLNIKAKDPKEYKNIAAYLENPSLKNIIEKVTYSQNQLVFERLVAITDTLKKGGFVVTLFLAFAASLAVFNTIRLMIYSNSEQIGIMRLVGASNNFIRGPYVIEGFLYGVLAGILSYILWLPTIKAISPYVYNLVQVNLVDYLANNFLKLFIYQIIFGVVLGVFSSLIAVRKYLRI